MAKMKYQDITIVKEGKLFVMPEGMSYDEGIIWMTRQRDAEEEMTTLDRTFKAFPLDGAAALGRAIKAMFGFSLQRGTTVSLPVASGERIDVPWGAFKVPGIDGVIRSMVGWDRTGIPLYRVYTEYRRKDQAKVKALYDAVEVEITERSVYRGQAIRFEFPEEGEFDPGNAPEFLDLTKVSPDDFILRADVQEIVNHTLFTPLIYREELKADGIPIKRGILLEGKYGVGKTLLAYIAAHYATTHGWTYLHLPDVRQLPQALQFAKDHEPCLIFAEDIDQSMGTQERTDEVNEVLNTIDGVEIKGRDIMVVLTSNHAETINQAMVRYGRVDTVITIPPPDAEAAIRLIQLYGRGRLVPEIDLTIVGHELNGQIPAMIREVVERAKLGAIWNGHGKATKLTASDLLTAARTMVRHQALLLPKPADTRSEMVKAAAVLATALTPKPTEFDLDDSYGLFPADALPVKEVTRQ